jgi:putative ABC transport system permease protein
MLAQSFTYLICGALMQTLIQDLRYAFRILVKNPTFTFITLFTLSVGIGGNTAIFSVLNNVFFRPLPFEDEQSLVRLRDYTVTPSGEVSIYNTADRNFNIIREQNKVFSGVVAQRGQNLTLIGETPERVSVVSVSSDSWSTMGVKPILGRVFSSDEERLGPGSGAALIGYGLWQRRFGGDSTIVGKPLTLDDRIYNVIGVLPKGYNFPYDAEVWLTAQIDPAGDDDSAVFARLKPGVDLEQARIDLGQVAQRIREQFPETSTGYGIDIKPLRESLLGEEHKISILLLAVVGFFLLIACVNVANLLLSRSVIRQKEFAIRAALGAGRWRLIRQLLSESLLLSILGGLGGLILTLWISRNLVVLIPSNLTKQLNLADVIIDARVLGFTTAVSILTGVIFGLVPAIKVSVIDLQTFLKDGGRSGSGSGRSRKLLNAFAVSQISLALVLLTGAGLMIENIQRQLRQDLGFETKNLLTMQISFPQSRYSNGQQRSEAVKQIIQNIRNVPGVASVGVTTANPLGGGTWWAPVAVEGTETVAPDASQFVNHRLVSPEIFESMGIPLLKGQFFEAQDSERSQEVVIISSKMARQFWPSEDPIGKRIRVNRSGTNLRTVIGVVGDVKDSGEKELTWYLPYYQNASNPFAESIHLMIRTETEPGNLIKAVQGAIWEADKNLAAYKITAMDQYYSETLSKDRLGTVLTVFFASFGLILAALGIFGVISYAVIQRTHEIGIRLALGAEPGDILRLVMREGVKLVIIGVLIGSIAAIALTRLALSFIQNVDSINPFMLVALLLILIGIALLATFIPARRAAKVDPMIAMRCE